jgi:uncharacterized protein (DUF433 family)
MTMTQEKVDYQDRIVSDPEILVGKPVIKGTRIPVELVLEYLTHNPRLDDLFADYPRLTLDDVKACFAYATTLVQQSSQRAIEKH